MAFLSRSMKRNWMSPEQQKAYRQYIKDNPSSGGGGIFDDWYDYINPVRYIEKGADLLGDLTKGNVYTDEQGNEVVEGFGTVGDIATGSVIKDVTKGSVYTDEKGVEHQEGFGGFSGVSDAVGDAYNDVSGNTAADAALNAAQLQYKSGQEALAFQKGIYDQSREDMAPWLESGKKSLSLLDELMQGGRFDPQEFDYQGGPDFQRNEFDYKESPGYQFAMDEGIRGYDRSAAAGGSFGSGGNRADIMSFASNLASRDYGNQFNRFRQGEADRYQQYTDESNRDYGQYGDKFRADQMGANNFYNKLSGQAGTGQSQAQSLGVLGGQYGAAGSNLMTGGANALAAGQIGAANARGAGTGNLIKLLMQGGGMLLN